MYTRTLSALAASFLALTACHRKATPVPDTAVIRMGTYRAVLTLPSGELPFGLQLTRDGTRTVGYLLNAAERVKLDEVALAGAHLLIRMPGYENTLTADAQGTSLVGEVVLVKSGATRQRIALRAELGPTYRFFAAPGPVNIDVSGRWAVKFTDENGNSELAVGEFTQSADVVQGTFLAETGDHRYLEGQVQGGALSLSTFDGAHAFLYRAEMQSDGGLAGDFWVGTAHHERWTGRRDANARLPDAYSLATMRGGATHFNFDFPDLAGHLVSSKDSAFRGKVMIVVLAGSWCPNCHDEAAVLASLYRTYRAKGVEIVSLMFEHFGDFPRAAEAVRRFREHYGIEYTTLIAGISDKDEAAKKLPMLNRVYGFPTTIFIDRRGVVRKIHTGFSGPATGDHHTELVDAVKATLDNLIAES